MSDDVTDLITVLTERALAVSTGTGRPPSAVRLAAGTVQVEITWPAEPVAAAAVAVTTLVEAAPAPDPGTMTVCSDTVGVFYRAPEPGAEPFVSEGDLVAAGQQVGLVEAMKLMIPLHADRAGRIERFLVDNGRPVEHGQPVLLLRGTDA